MNTDKIEELLRMILAAQIVQIIEARTHEDANHAKPTEPASWMEREDDLMALLNAVAGRVSHAPV